jgi:hypothetical protein
LHAADVVVARRRCVHGRAADVEVVVWWQQRLAERVVRPARLVMRRSRTQVYERKDKHKLDKRFFAKKKRIPLGFGAVGEGGKPADVDSELP